MYNEKKDLSHLIAQLFIRVNGRFNVRNAKKVAVPRYLEKAMEQGTSFMINKLGATDLDLTIIDWLRLQDYRIDTRRKKEILPGQIRAGLGIGHEIEELMLSMVAKKGRDGMLNTPEHWHNAYLYYTSTQFHFLNPVFEGFFRSINESVRKEIETHHLTSVAWAISNGKLYHRPTDERITWVTPEQVCPVSRRLKAYFNSDYADLVMRNYHPKDYYIKWDDSIILPQA